MKVGQRSALTVGCGDCGTDGVLIGDLLDSRSERVVHEFPDAIAVEIMQEPDSSSGGALWCVSDRAAEQFCSNSALQLVELHGERSRPEVEVVGAACERRQGCALPAGADLRPVPGRCDPDWRPRDVREHQP